MDGGLACYLLLKCFLVVPCLFSRALSGRVKVGLALALVATIAWFCLSPGEDWLFSRRYRRPPQTGPDVALILVVANLVLLLLATLVTHALSSAALLYALSRLLLSNAGSPGIPSLVVDAAHEKFTAPPRREPGTENGVQARGDGIEDDGR